MTKVATKQFEGEVVSKAPLVGSRFVSMEPTQGVVAWRAIEQKLPSLLDSLVACPPYRAGDKPPITHGRGVYLFTEAGTHLYVGQTRDFHRRWNDHTRPSSRENSAPFAFNIAKRAAGLPTGTRLSLAAHPEFRPHFASAKARVRTMEFRYVEIPALPDGRDDAVTSTMFEVYAAVVLGTEGDFNDFSTH